MICFWICTTAPSSSVSAHDGSETTRKLVVRPISRIDRLCDIDLQPAIRRGLERAVVEDRDVDRGDVLVVERAGAELVAEDARRRLAADQPREWGGRGQAQEQSSRDDSASGVTLACTVGRSEPHGTIGPCWNGPLPGGADRHRTRRIDLRLVLASRKARVPRSSPVWALPNTSLHFAWRIANGSFPGTGLAVLHGRQRGLPSARRRCRRTCVPA